jgi:hypothetical protein
VPKITSSQGELIRRVREASLDVYAKTVIDPFRTLKIDELASAAELCESFVYGYTSIDDPEIDSDDEILNWTLGDVTGDLGAAIWCLSCGFYKAAASNLRNALDLGVTALYFQVRENTDPAEKGWNKFFSEWDRGERSTPSWGEIKPFLKSQASLRNFDQAHTCDVVNELHAHFGYLSAYTHGRAFTVDGRAVRAIETADSHSPSFDASQFEHVSNLTLTTVCWICTIWQIAFPQIIETEPLGPMSDPAPYRQIFSAHPQGLQAMAFRATRSDP